MSKDRSEIDTGEPATLKIRISGEGNLKNIILPQLPEIEGMKIYPPTFSESISYDGYSIRGYKQAEFLLVAERSGNFKIPKLKFSYFDTKSYNYLTLTAPELFINARVKTIAGSSSSKEKKFNVLAGVFRPIRINTKLRSAKQSLHTTQLFWIAVLVPPFVMFSLWSAAKAREIKERLTPQSSPRMALSHARKELKAVKKLFRQGGGSELFTEIRRILLEYLSKRAGMEVSGLPMEELRKLLNEKGLQHDIMEFLCSELESLEIARFSPESSSPRSPLDAVENANLILSRFEKINFRN